MLVGSTPHHATSPPPSIENKHVVAHFQFWWALHLTTTSPPPTTTENEYVCTRFQCWSAIYLTTTSLPPTTTTENKYTHAHFQCLSAILPPATLTNDYPCTCFSGALLLTSPPPAPTIENERSYSFSR